jgi:TldD protein
MIENYVEQARESLLTPAGIGMADLDRSLAALMAPGVNSADLYFQLMRHESWSLEDGIVKSGSYSIDQGVGVRAIAGDKTGFSYSDEIMIPSLMEACKAAAAISRTGNQQKALGWKIPAVHSLYPAIDPLVTARDEQKVELLQEADELARSLDSRVQQVMASLSAAHEIVLVCSTDGTLSADIRPLIRMNISVLVEDGGRREQGFSGGGGRHGFDYFLESDLPASYVNESVRQALVNLEAGPAPAGEMTVVLGPGWPGVLLHEAIGHGLEGDFNRKGTSAFSGREGEMVASKYCTVVDDGTMQGRRGSLNVDDEGTPTQQTTLIENGRLVGYMQDKMNANLMGVPTTGNGRRESYAHAPLPRMTNTYMLPGSHEPDEIIASVENGIYARNFSGGQVDITSGKFVFSASESYLIKDGKLGSPVKDATLIGDGPSVLHQVSMVGNDLQLDTGIGVCGKEGQSVPVGVGQPTLKIDKLTVGGVGS